MGKKKKGKIKPFKFNYPLIDRLKDQKIEQKELVDVFSTSISMNLNILDVLNDSKTTEEKRVAILQNNFDYINCQYNCTNVFPVRFHFIEKYYRYYFRLLFLKTCRE